MRTDGFEYLRVEIRNRILFITFNRPDKLNACNAAGHDEMPRVLREFGATDEADVAVVTGAGRAFSVGGDFDLVEEVNHDPAGRIPGLISSASELVRAHIDLDKPIVAAINGPAFGAGAAFGLLCDFIVMEQQARISDGHLRGALAAGDGGVLIWPLAVGMVKAKQYLLTADWVTADEAERLGLVTEVVEEGESLARATEIAERLAKAPQVALRYTKRALHHWLRQAWPIFDHSLSLEAITMARPEVQVALDSLRESRTPAMPPDPRNP
ncbi:MAG: enoyl-CoA hydratase [Propionibacteriales bacterium]|nr:enoyl-CoA hydratase [Propionibacteriales bacterium]